MGWYQRRVHGGSSSHCLSLVAALEILRPYKTNKMNPLFVISALFASAIAAPLAHAGFAAPLAHAGYAAPLLHAAPIAAPAAISLPAPHVTQAKEADITTIHKPTPVHVAKPVPYDVPTPVQGHPIVRKVQGAPIVRHHHTNVVAQPALHHAPIAYAGHHAGFAPLAVAHHA